MALAGVGVDVQRVAVLREVDFAVGAGESIGLVGPNGSGKSTLLRVLATLLAPVAGVVRILGAEPATRAWVAVRSRIALVEHAPALYPQLSLRENLRLRARLTGRAAAAADEALDVVGLARAASRRADRCSQGMQRRAALAAVLLTDPQLLLLDEVHAGLDPQSVGLVDLVIGRARRRGGAAVVVSHDVGQLATVTDRVVEIVDGRLREIPVRSRRESA